MPKFDRDVVSYGKTWAFTSFMKHHSEINNLYWSFVPAQGYLTHISKNTPGTTSPITFFHASGPNVRRLASSMEQWNHDFLELSNWIRLSLIVAALGYLETYIRSIVEISLRSRPGILYGKPTAIDGIEWLKLGVEPDISKNVESIVKGEWSSRIAAYGKLFGTIPAALKAEQARLDALRVIRNGASHTFGRGTDYIFNKVKKTHKPITRISERSLLKCLAAVETTAKAIERHLGPKFVGEFELIRHFHSWKNLAAPGKNKLRAVHKNFSSAVGTETGHNYGGDFCKELIAEYEGK